MPPTFSLLTQNRKEFSMPKASDNIKIYRNPNGPVVSTVNRRVLEQDGLTFKDIDGTGRNARRLQGYKKMAHFA